MCDGHRKVDVAVATSKPATGGRSPAHVRRVLKRVLLAVCECDERLHERADGDRFCRIIPLCGNYRTRLRVKKKKRDIVAGESALKLLRSRLSEQRLR